MMKGIVTVALALVAVFCPAISLADTVYVDYDGLGDYTRIQDGIDAAQDGDTGLVMAAFGGPVTFRGAGNRNLNFGGKNITLSVLAGQDVSIDCEGADRAILLPAGTDSTSMRTPERRASRSRPPRPSPMPCSSRPPVARTNSMP